jgi:hypothetical protein
MRRHSLVAAGLVAVCAIFAMPAPGSADDVMVGGRVGYYSEVEEPFVGAELLVPVSGAFYFNPNFEYVFVEDLNYMTFNADFHYDLPMSGRTMVWLGAGLGLVRLDFEGPDNSETDAAANFLAGLGWRTGNVVPYFQGKVIAKDDTEFSIGFGLRF